VTSYGFRLSDVLKKGGFAVSGRSVQYHRFTNRMALNITRKVFQICLLCYLVTPACTQAESPLLGGFYKVQYDCMIQEAAEFALGEISKIENAQLQLKQIISAERQVVSGLNYRLDLDLTKNNQPLRMRAIVWRKLDGSMVLTSCNPF